MQVLFNIKLQGSGVQLYKKETPTQVFYFEFCEILKNTFFKEHLQTTASVKASSSQRHMLRNWNVSCLIWRDS